MRNIYVNQAILEDPDFLSMSHEAQRAWWHLKFDSRMGISGLARMSWKSLLGVLDLDETRGRRVLAELTQKWFQFDEAKGLLWLVDGFRHERNRSPQVMTAVVKEFTSCPRSFLLVKWWETYEMAFASDKEGKRAISIYIGGASMGHSGGLDTPLARDSGSYQAPPPCLPPVRMVPPKGGTPEAPRTADHADAEPPTAAISVLTFPIAGKGPKTWDLTRDHLASLETDFPGVNALAECRHARAWCVANPKRRKTADGMPQFLVTWLAKAQNASANRHALDRAAPHLSKSSSPAKRDDSPEAKAERRRAELYAEERKAGKPDAEARKTSYQRWRDEGYGPREITESVTTR